MKIARRPAGVDALRVGLSALLRRTRGQRAGDFRAQAERLLDLDTRRAQRVLVARLRGLLLHAAATVPHYQAAFAQADFQPHRFRALEQWADVPELSKLTFRAGAGALRSSRYTADQLVEYRTGGTTGAPVAFAQTPRSIAFKDACVDAMQPRMGWLAGHRPAYLWGADQDAPQTGGDLLRRTKRAVEGWIDGGAWLPVGALDDTRIEAVVAALREHSPDVVQAYPSMADAIAKWMLARGEFVPVPRFLLSAEPTFDDQRARIAKAFRTEVFTFYGAREIGWIALECPQEKRLHVNTAGVHVEDTADGRLLVTDLVNDAMPLLRYEVGDRGRMARDRCACGDPRPVIDAVEGRIGDTFVLPSGKQVPLALSDTRSRQLRREGVLEAQLVQTAPDALTIRYVPGPSFHADHLASFQANLDALFGGELRLDVAQVERLVPEPNGKVRWCIAYTPEAQS